MPDRAMTSAAPTFRLARRYARGFAGFSAFAVALACGGLWTGEDEGARIEPTATLLQVRAPLPDDPANDGPAYMDLTGRLVVPPIAAGPERVDAAAFLVFTGRTGYAWVDRSSGRIQRSTVGAAYEAHDLGENRVLIVRDHDILVWDMVSGKLNELRRPPGSSVPLPPTDGEGPIGWCEAEGVCGHLDASLQWIGPARYANVTAFTGGRGLVVDRENLLWSLMDANGKTYGAFQILLPFGDGVALVLDDEQRSDSENRHPHTFRVRLVDGFGATVAELGRRAPDLQGPPPSPSDGRLLLPLADGSAEIMDTTGRVLLTLPPGYPEGWVYAEGLAAVGGEGQWRYVDQNGAVVLPGPYPLGGKFQRGLARVASDTWIRKDGSEIRLVAPSN